MRKLIEGNTVRLKCTFKNFDNQNSDPNLVKIVFYDQKYNKIDEQILGGSNKMDIGVYFYNYIVPQAGQRIIYEWYGEVGGSPSLDRDEFLTVFKR